MTVVLTYKFEPNDDGTLDPAGHRKLQKECPGLKLPGVLNYNVYRNLTKRLMFAEVELENYSVMDAWESWAWSPEGRDWALKFNKCGKFVELIIFEKMD